MSNDVLDEKHAVYISKPRKFSILNKLFCVINFGLEGFIFVNVEFLYKVSRNGDFGQDLSWREHLRLQGFRV